MLKDLTKQNFTTGKKTSPVVKIKLNTKSKILVLGTVLVALVGLFSPLINLHAATTGKWYFEYKKSTFGIEGDNKIAGPYDTFEECNSQTVGGLISTGTIIRSCFQQDTSPTITPKGETPPTGAGVCFGPDKKPNGLTELACTGLNTWSADNKPPTENPAKSDFEKLMEGKGCSNLMNFDMGTCFLKFLYYGIQMPLAGILWISAKFFDYLIFFTINNPLFRQDFVKGAWAVVRDLSNIFFILILLYIAVKIILGIGGSEVKKMIANVIIIALLINFSMFFTGVIIDSANILALIFYNKIDVTYKGADGKPATRPDTPVGGEKGVSGSMANSFNLTKLVTEDMFTEAKDAVNKVPGGGEKLSDGEAPTGLMITIVLIAIVIMSVAAYAFIVAGLSFLGRMIELLVLIIFSPFAFMSFTVPKLAGIEYLGWESWSKRLLAVAFMAPIFMFFLYFIFLLMKPLLEQVKNNTGQGFISTIINMIVPTLIIVVLLLKAVEFAKKGSGKFGEMAMAGAKMVGGLALGAATGGAAMLASNSVGRAARNVANDDELKTKAASGDKGAQRKLALANSLAKSSFDLRQTGVGKYAAKKSGMDFDRGLGAVGMSTEKLKGGRKERDKEEVEKHEEKLKSYELSKGDAEKQDAIAKDPKNPENIRAAEYGKDKDQAKKNVEKMGRTFNEALFKLRYTAGGNLKAMYGLDKTVSGGRVSGAPDSKAVNAERRKAYAYSLEYPGAKIDEHGDIKKDKNGEVIRNNIRDGFKSSFTSGAASALTTPVGLALTAATGGLAVPIAGLAAAVKDMIHTKLQAGKVTGMVFAEHSETVASVRKGKTADEKLSELIKKAGSSHKSEADHASKEATAQIKERQAPAAATSTPAAAHVAAPAAPHH